MSVRKEYVQRERNIRFLLREGKRLKHEAIEKYGPNHKTVKSVENSIQQLQEILLVYYSH